MTEEQGRDYVLAMARELYGRTVYTHKTHEKERQIWSGKAGLMYWVNLGLVSATTVFAVISVSLQPRWVLILTALFAAATTAFVVWQSSFDPVGKENRHRTAAKELLCIRDQLLLLIERCHIGTEHVGHLQFSLESITRELTSIYKFAPDTSGKAYDLASSVLKGGELTFSDEEIDAFLPTRFRKHPPASA
jgi:SMODS and SLOG-associating 2TM effector domain family 4